MKKTSKIRQKSINLPIFNRKNPSGRSMSILGIQNRLRMCWDSPNTKIVLLDTEIEMSQVAKGR